MDQTTKESSEGKLSPTPIIIGIAIFAAMFFIPGIQAIGIIFGLPALGIFFIILGSYYKKHDRSRAGNVLLTLGILALVAYGACWGFLFFGLSGL